MNNQKRSRSTKLVKSRGSCKSDGGNKGGHIVRFEEGCYCLVEEEKAKSTCCCRYETCD